MTPELCSVLLCFVLFPIGLCKQKGLANRFPDNSIQYFEKVHNVTIPIMIHFDKALTQKIRKIHQNRTKNTIKTISKNLLRKVEKIFQSASLNHRVKLKLVDAKFLKRRMVNNTNVSMYLRRYCKWQGERKKHWKRNYFSVLLTGLDVYYLNNGKKVWSSTGRGFIGGLCSTYHSCTLLEWKARNIVFLLAHEIAHSLGVRHDSQRLGCSSKKHIMSRDYDPIHNPDTWSTCSQLDLQKFLTSKKCLKTGFRIKN